MVFIPIDEDLVLLWTFGSVILSASGAPGYMIKIDAPFEPFSIDCIQNQHSKAHIEFYIMLTLGKFLSQ